MLKYRTGDRLFITNNHESGHRFKEGELVKIIVKLQNGTKYGHYLAEGVYSGERYYINDSELSRRKNGDEMNLKHDGYVVINLCDGTVKYGLTKEQATFEVDSILRNGIESEDILVYAPHTNIGFRHSVELIEGGN